MINLIGETSGEIYLFYSVYIYIGSYKTVTEYEPYLNITKVVFEVCF